MSYSPTLRPQTMSHPAATFSRKTGDFLRGVLKVGVEDDEHRAVGLARGREDRLGLPQVPAVLENAEGGPLPRLRARKPGRPIRGTIVHEEHLALEAVFLESLPELADERRDDWRLVVCRDDDGEVAGQGSLDTPAHPGREDP